MTPAKTTTTDPETDQAVRETVRKGYANIAVQSAPGQRASCCGPQAKGATCAERIGYGPEDLAVLPETADMGLGCGNPTALASLCAGEVVLDLGSGGGLDCYIAGPKVGPTGRAIGVDMTPEMLSRARSGLASYRQRTGLDNVEFRLGEIEHLPVADSSVDVIISNCVINLSPEKPQVFREAFRVLRAGGRLLVSDLVLLRPLPDRVRESVEAYVGCVAGASLREDYLRHIREAGFTGVGIAREARYGCDVAAPGASGDDLREAMGSVVSVAVRATKPA